ncbi:HD domain-containing protein [Lactobacillus sp. S2-2]|uniref:HD domain-containing protein n=1 Tax=Lactobacillus sp. S2-2 TaxID=2692917 RepID=UPI001F20FCDA|nr:HD domain-containing protein [Lactobacillus sp. S2-2]MCF6515134.1 HD domain-containing protein [Lactobacillus sp. S2-2]
MKSTKWYENEEYLSIVSDLLDNDKVKKLDNYVQHHHSTRLKHSINVSYISFKIAKKWHLDYKSTARAGLLHDLFYYDWREVKFDLGSHAFIHPKIALRNAKKITSLNPIEQDIILKHMWGLTISNPKYKESLIVSLVDDLEAVTEFSKPLKRRVRKFINIFN